jgi:hypothetical protein
MHSHCFPPFAEFWIQWAKNRICSAFLSNFLVSRSFSRGLFLTLSVVSLVLSAPGISAAETVVFQDTFDAPDGSSVNTDIEARQTGGQVISPYKANAGRDARSSIQSNHLKRVGVGPMELVDDLADLVGKSFTFAVDMRYPSPESWGSISLVSDAGTDRGHTPCSIRLHATNAGGVVVVNSGSTVEPFETFFQANQLSNLLGQPFRISDFHNYKYVVHMDGTVGIGTFYIDGVEVPLKDPTIDFGDGSGRRINFISMEPVSVIEFDNLKITVDP